MAKSNVVKLLLAPDPLVAKAKTDHNPRGAGRRSKAYYQADVQEVLNGSARVAARILQAHVEGKRGYKTLKPSLQRAYEYCIDHAIGKSRQKIEHSGGIMTYKQLADSAADLDNKPRDILADVEEISRKYQAGRDNEKP